MNHTYLRVCLCTYLIRVTASTGKPANEVKDMICVYEIKSKRDGKRYIGSTIDKKKRWRAHKSDLRKNKHHNIYLQRAWNKYGKGNFEFNVIIELKEDIGLLDYEQWYLDILHPEYNMAVDARSPMKGRKWTEEQKAKLKGRFKGIPRSEEVRKKISEAHKGKPKSRAHKEKLRKSLRGEGCGKSILTRDQVIEIRRKYDKTETTYLELAKEYSVKRETIGSIINGSRWKHVGGPTSVGNNSPLDEQMVEKIRDEYKEGMLTQKELGEKYNTCRETIWRVVNGKTWVEAGGPIKGIDYQ